MRTNLARVATVAAAGLLALPALDYATYAATGDSLVLGNVNSSDNVTALARTTSGAALRVSTKSAANPPFAVNGTGKVANLNADQVDGKSAEELGPQTSSFFVHRDQPAGSHTLEVPVTANGGYLLTGSAEMRFAAGPSSPIPVHCFLRVRKASGVVTAFAEERGATLPTIGEQVPLAALSLAGAAPAEVGDFVQLVCSATQNFTTGAGSGPTGMRLTVTPTNITEAVAP